MYYDIHTHIPQSNSRVTSILNVNAGDFASFCGLDLKHTFYSLGLHPWKIREENWPGIIDYIEKNAVFDNIKAIGECGLDKLCDTSWDLQNKVFPAQILLSEKLKKPLIIHCVKAFNEIIVYKKQYKPLQAWIIHGFRGKPEQAMPLLRHGFFLSFGEKFNQQTLQNTPIDQLFFETDDMKNPDIEKIYQEASLILSMDTDLLVSQIDKNVKKIF